VRHRIFKQSTEQDVFTDLLFNTLLGFAFMFAIAFMLISTPEKAGDIESKAEILITIRWADKHPDDVDALGRPSRRPSLVSQPRHWPHALRP